MAWFKVDDHLYSHPKWLMLPKPARALWVTAGSWSAGHLLDGFVPTDVLPLLGGSVRDANALVRVGFWTTADGGYRFHDWAEYQPVKKAVMEKRAKDAERLRKWREKRDQEQEEHRE